MTEFGHLSNENGIEDDEINDEEEDDDEDDGISFEKYVELRTKMDREGDNEEAHYKIVEAAGYTREDWDFYKNVWMVEMMSNRDKSEKFSELYSKYSSVS